MKRLLVLMLALGMLTACTKEEIVIVKPEIEQTAVKDKSLVGGWKSTDPTDEEILSLALAEYNSNKTEELKLNTWEDAVKLLKDNGFTDKSIEKVLSQIRKELTLNKTIVYTEDGKYISSSGNGEYNLEKVGDYYILTLDSDGFVLSRKVTFDNDQYSEEHDLFDANYTVKYEKLTDEEINSFLLSLSTPDIEKPSYEIPEITVELK